MAKTTIELSPSEADLVREVLASVIAGDVNTEGDSYEELLAAWRKESPRYVEHATAQNAAPGTQQSVESATWAKQYNDRAARILRRLI